jgi:hypothetical protein
MQILIAEYDGNTATMYRRFLEGRRNHHVIIANGGLDCLTFYHEKLPKITSEKSSSLQGQLFDVIILD